jgi:hypothetical protein
MLVNLALSFLQPLGAPAGMYSAMPGECEWRPQCCLVSTASAPAELSPEKEAQLSALRKMLFRTGRPQLLSHDLPALPLDPPAPVSATVASDTALRQLHVQPTGFTPYDRYLGVVRSVMADLPQRKKSISTTCRLLRVAHAFRYSPGDPYRADSPAVTAVRKAGDCKAKALWLYDQLGDSSVLYVIGKVSRAAKNSHAWLYWRWENRWWILDPTNQSAPIAAETVAAGRYVPYYSFTQATTYRHPATYLLVAQADGGRTSAVATHGESHSRRR